MINRFFKYDRRSIDYLSGLIEQSRALDYAYFQAATANAVFPSLHRSADLRGAMLPRSLSRAQLASSDNPFQVAVSHYV